MNSELLGEGRGGGQLHFKELVCTDAQGCALL